MPKTKRQVSEQTRDRAIELIEEMAQDVTEESQDRQPGSKVRQGRGLKLKVPWTRADVERRFPKVEFTPGETLGVSFQGNRWQLLAGIRMVAPEPIYRQYMEYCERTSKAGQVPKGVIGRIGNISFTPGAGGLEPE